MKNKLFGQITDIANAGIPVQGLKIEAWDDDWPDSDDYMGRAITNQNGQYKIYFTDRDWDSDLLGLVSRFPDIYITVDIKNADGKWVRLGKSGVFKDQPLNKDLQIDLGVKIEKEITKHIPFDPKKHGFKFVNSFLISPNILNVNLGSWNMGFCGGMSAASRHHFLNDSEIPQDKTTPKDGTPLFKKLLKRQITSTPPELIAQMYDWQSAPNVADWWRKPSIGQRTKSEWPKLKNELDNDRPTVIVLIRSYGYFDDPTQNHQVLAYGYEYNPSTKDLLIYVYDPNKPGQENRLSMSLGLPEGKLFFRDSTKRRTRGFFVNPAGEIASSLSL
ncbi:hypothetical protein ACFLXI_03940 [Chloroflexota bacterium]